MVGQIQRLGDRRRRLAAHRRKRTKVGPRQPDPRCPLPLVSERPITRHRRRQRHWIPLWYRWDRRQRLLCERDRLAHRQHRHITGDTAEAVAHRHRVVTAVSHLHPIDGVLIIIRCSRNRHCRLLPNVSQRARPNRRHIEGLVGSRRWEQRRPGRLRRDPWQRHHIQRRQLAIHRVLGVRTIRHPRPVFTRVSTHHRRNRVSHPIRPWNRIRRRRSLIPLNHQRIRPRHSKREGHRIPRKHHPSHWIRRDRRSRAQSINSQNTQRVEVRRHPHRCPHAIGRQREQQVGQRRTPANVQRPPVQQIKRRPCTRNVSGVQIDPDARPGIQVHRTRHIQLRESCPCQVEVQNAEIAGRQIPVQIQHIQPVADTTTNVEQGLLPGLIPRPCCQHHRTRHRANTTKRCRGRHRNRPCRKTATIQQQRTRANRRWPRVGVGTRQNRRARSTHRHRTRTCQHAADRRRSRRAEAKPSRRINRPRARDRSGTARHIQRRHRQAIRPNVQRTRSRHRDRSANRIVHAQQQFAVLHHRATRVRAHHIQQHGASPILGQLTRASQRRVQRQLRARSGIECTPKRPQRDATIRIIDRKARRAQQGAAIKQQLICRECCRCRTEVVLGRDGKHPTRHSRLSIKRIHRTEYQCACTRLGQS